MCVTGSGSRGYFVYFSLAYGAESGCFMQQEIKTRSKNTHTHIHARASPVKKLSNDYEKPKFSAYTPCKCVPWLGAGKAEHVARQDS